MVKPKGRPKNYYTVYERATDRVLATGTADECAGQIGVTVASFYCLVTRAPQRINGKYEVFVDKGAAE